MVHAIHLVATPMLHTVPQFFSIHTVRGPHKIELSAEATVGSHKQLFAAGSQQLQQLAATTLILSYICLQILTVNIACSTQIAESTTWAMHAIQSLAADSNHKLSAVGSG